MILGRIQAKLAAGAALVAAALLWLWRLRRGWERAAVNEVKEEISNADKRRAEQIRRAADAARRAPGGMLGDDTRGYRD